MQVMRAAVVGALLFVVIAACGKQEQSTGDGSRPVIGVSLLTMSHSFFQELSKAIKAEAEQQGFDLIMVAGEFDPARQQNQINDFIVKRVAAILLCPTDSRAIGTSVKKANEAGIPVFTADIAVLAEGVSIVSHVASDNYQAGRLAAKAVIEAIGGRGKIGIIDHPEVESVILRTRGFMDELNEQREKNGVEIEVVSRLSGGGVKDKAFKAAEDMLQAHPDLDAIFAINDPSALGVVAAIEKAGKSGRVRVVGIDGMPEGRKAVRDGKIYAEILQHPQDIGRRAIQTIAAYLSGEEVPPKILIPTSIYRQEDAKKDPMLATAK